MRILAFVDVHGNMSALERLKKKAKRADAVVCAGDMSVFEEGLDKLFGLLSTFEKPVLVVPGNHETEEAIRKQCSHHKNIYFIHKRKYLLSNYLVIGYGGGGFSLEDRDFTNFVNKIKTNKRMVLVTHAPPHNTRLDLVNGEHHGNKSITSFIKKVKPALVVCGHFHENAGKKDELGRTIIVNPGTEGKIIKL